MVCLTVLFLALSPLVSCKKHAEVGGPVEDGIKSDERVVFFPTDGWQTDDGTSWHVRIHGWIFEPEADSLLRDRVTDLAGTYFDDGVLTPERRERFRRRLRYFIADNEGGKELTVRIAGKRMLLPASDGDGHFETVIELPSERVKKHARNGVLTFHVLPGEEYTGPPPEGTIHLVNPEGVTVISDVDDTVKVSHVTDRRKLLRNTFLKPYRAVPGMAKTYRGWAERTDVDFLYLSNSPWKLYPPLSRFFEDERFPAAPVDLLRVELDDTRLLKLFEASKEKKWHRLTGYFDRYPDRSFILVGDSGEADPELYGDLARTYPDRVRAIFIRSVSGKHPDDGRFREAFDGVSGATWTVFRDPEQLQFPE